MQWPTRRPRQLYRQQSMLQPCVTTCVTGNNARNNSAIAAPSAWDADGKLAEDIVAAYWTLGFYVFENVISETELAELRADVDRGDRRCASATEQRHGPSWPSRVRTRLREDPVSLR